MKKITSIFSIVVFFSLIILPIVFFNFKPNSVSMIDNRVLIENPFKLEGDLTDNIEKYVNDRIGFREEIITANTVLNDRFFNEMSHPIYSYGKDGHVFGAGITTKNGFSEYHEYFADMVKSIQIYCEDRGVPFVFVFNPAKPAVYSDKIRNGIIYNREWVTNFFTELDKRNVKYIDNTPVMIELREKGIDGFNKKYDANHWNDIGAFYGTNNVLNCLKKDFPSLHVNEETEFNKSSWLAKSLLVSKFPIKEEIPTYETTNRVQSIAGSYQSIELNPGFRAFDYFVNEERKIESSPKVLSFQGSYMNGCGGKFFKNAFSEYIIVHDYQNVIDFPYYFNIFNPDCVVFEVAEYTFDNAYFNKERMSLIDYNPLFSSVAQNCEEIDIGKGDIIVETSGNITKLSFNIENDTKYVWLKLDKEYDVKKTENGYSVTVEKSTYLENKDSMRFYAMY